MLVFTYTYKNKHNNCRQSFRKKSQLELTLKEELAGWATPRCRFRAVLACRSPDYHQSGFCTNLGCNQSLSGPAPTITEAFSTIGPLKAPNNLKVQQTYCTSYGQVYSEIAWLTALISPKMGMALLCIALYCIILHCIALNYIELHCLVLTFH